jgi:CRISPR-associated endonuclease/helicase Cas3
LLAYCIAGHHAGLPDWESGRAGLRQRLENAVQPFDQAPLSILSKAAPALPDFDWSNDARQLSFQVAFFVRMLFSCLVDSDFLATEGFMAPERAVQRPDRDPEPADLLTRLDRHLAELKAGSRDSSVNRCRERVLSACRQKARLPPGLFSLNVPTGGGKTLSSLAFALIHAKAHNLRRVVYAIPFTSIIEQTAENFRVAFGDLSHALLEHHSNVGPDEPGRQTASSRLAAENWDATVIATTNVQLFDSLFASRTSRCRKLHRLARSVIVLDEAQALPPDLLAPTLAALNELVRNYGSTVVLCTATQPAIELREGFLIGLNGVVPIIEDPVELHESLRRTRVEVAGEAIDDEELARRLADEKQVLCIVNSRAHAADLYRLLCQRAGGDGCLHLSASMCPMHRADIVAEIRHRLDPKLDQSCRVVSTQVIEAGIDIDFPAVYRAAAGLDSIAQAAGRCNREGQLSDARGRLAPGRVVVFDYDEQAHRAPPFIRRAADTAREVIPDHGADLLSPQAVEAYFRLHYWQQGGDDGRGWDRGRGEGRPSVLKCFDGKGLTCQFREAAERYRLIEDAQTSVLVPWGEGGRALRRELEDMPASPEPKHLRSWDRHSQRYSVGVFDRSLKSLMENQVLMERHERFYLVNDNAYDRELGLTYEAVGINADDMIF